MKQIFFIAMFLFMFTRAFSQKNGNITSKELAPKSGVEHTYVYQPPKDLAIPEKAAASIVYINRKRYDNKTIPLIKTGDRYEFSFKAPDSTEVLIMSITDENKKVIDNNNEAGYVSFLYDNSGKRFPSAGITSNGLLSGFASFILKLKVPAAELLQEYEKEYKLHPALKNETEYNNYLSLLYTMKKDTAKPQLIAFAKQMLGAKKDEAKWLTGANIYRMLKMDKALKKSEADILAVYPNGELARQRFWDKFYSAKEATAGEKLAAMKEYIAKFKDSSTNITDAFYNNIINSYLKNKDWKAINKYEPLVSNKMPLAYAYNNIAWDLTGHTPDSAGRDLEYAKIVSKKSVDIVEERMNNRKNDEEKDMLISAHNMTTDTYALLLYQSKQYDSAFYYQDVIQKRGGMEGDALERYAVYAEKAKGALFAKQFIEPQLLKGVNSPVMQDQLLSIYKKLNLPQEEYNRIAEKASMLAREKTAAMIKAKYGTEAAKDFTLKDLKGNTVSLSSLKDKVVVLDFWATWCGPCRASFPEMQQAVTKYKDDKEVVFLFIDAFERKEPKEMQEATAKFINDNKYSFQVLLDTKDEVATNYQVEAIPLKFIINKKGNIVHMANSINNISSVIEAAKKF